MIIVIMGVSGCGKTTVGKTLARALGGNFIDGDDYHPPANIEKMSNGIPLTDDDRLPWLKRLHDVLVEYENKGSCTILACSSLKQKYRDVLKSETSPITFIHLTGTYDEINALIHKRSGHFMKPAMLESQFQALEKPEDALEIPVTLAVEEQISLIRGTLNM